MTQLFANAARTTLASGISDSDTTLTVALGDAFPVANTGTGAVGGATDWFKAVLDSGSAIEIVYVRTHTSGSETFSNVQRGQEGTTAVAWSAGAVIGLRVTAADMAGAAMQSEVNVFTKNQSVTPSALTSGATITVDASLSNNFKLTLATNATLSNPTNSTDGMVVNIRIKQDATGSRTLAYGSKYKWAGGAAPALSTAANAVDFLSMYYDATDDRWECVLSKGFA